MQRLFLVAVFSIFLGSTLHAQITAIRAGKLIDPETGKIETNQIIIVDGRDIKAVGSKVTVPAGATVVDLSQYTVMPGMMDAHAHLCMNTQHKRDANSYYITTLLDSTAKRAIQGGNGLTVVVRSIPGYPIIPLTGHTIEQRADLRATGVIDYQRHGFSCGQGEADRRRRVEGIGSVLGKRTCRMDSIIIHRREVAACQQSNALPFV
jgi:dihydroorotase-like cyclic amidohydrolase